MSAGASASASHFRFVVHTHRYEEVVAFYRDGLGFPVESEWDRGEHDRGVVVTAGFGSVEVLAARPEQETRPPVGQSIAIEVADVDAWFARLRDHGLARREPVDTPWGHRVLGLVDPEGIRLALYTVREPD